MALRSRSISPIRMILDDYSSAAITVGVNKREWAVPAGARILGVICHAGTAGTGGSPNLIDVNINGATIYTDQSKRPSLAAGVSGLFSDALPDVGVVQEAAVGTGVGVMSYDVDQVNTTGCARFRISIILGMG